MAEWFHNPLTLFGEAHNLEKLRKVLFGFRMGVKHAYGMKYFGGLMAGIRFQSPSDVEEFLSKKNYWGIWFKDFKEGNTMEGVFDRIAWLKIVGLPVNLWNEETLSRIANEFDKVIEPVEILPSIQDLSLGNIYNLTENKKKINDELLVEIN
ncbi:unnamed protein product [Lactuca virosa]|uniref:DUF4283 domain-containing protein n=1 Tax=Lactuca virosa TaxID=75947 RepID=A0AAU9LMN4_9ASTR|nr:unnamed protein product [Lactuca virosa]